MNKIEFIVKIITIATNNFLLETGLAALPRLVQNDLNYLQKELNDFVLDPCNKQSALSCINLANQKLLLLVGSVLVKDAARKATGVYGKLYGDENQQVKMILPTMIQSHHSLFNSFKFPGDDHKSLWLDLTDELGLEDFRYFFEIYYEIVQYNSQFHPCK